MERLDRGLAHTFEWMELCDRKFSSVSWACEKHTSQLGVRPRFWYMFAGDGWSGCRRCFSG